VPIEYFLGFSSLGIIISEDLLIIFPFMLIWLVLILGLFLIGNYIEKRNLKKQVTRKPKLLKHNEKVIITFIVSLIVLSILAMITMLLNEIFTSSQYVEKINSSGLFMLVFCGVLGVIVVFLKVEKANILMLSLGCLGFFLYAYSMKLGMDIARTQSGRYNGTEVYVGDKQEPLISSDSSYFIGKTENYVFIYNKNQEKTTIIPSSSVTKIILKKNF